MSRHQRFLSRAIAVAASSDHPRWRVGAVIVRGSSVISVSPNVLRNPPEITHGGPGTTHHAEVAALRKLKYQADRAEGATIYVARINRKSQPRLARPCLDCWKSLTVANVDTVVYSIYEESFGIERIYGV